MERGGCHFLVVEDQEDDAILIQRALAKSKHSITVHLCPSVASARDYLMGSGEFADRRRFPLPRAILSDLGFGAESGLQLLAWLRAQKSICFIPFIVLTGSSRHADICKAYELGANGVILKPSGLYELFVKLETVAAYWCDTAEYTVERESSGSD